MYDEANLIRSPVPKASLRVKKSLDICLSPDLIHLYDLKSKIVVVVDILRASSSIVAGIACGVKSITPFASLKACMAMKSQGYIIAGERGGQKVDGFDIGNSPFSYMKPDLANRELAVTTTNGTVAIEKSKEADEIIIGAFLNISSIASYLNSRKKNVLINCAGWKGQPNLEDTLFAGALAILLESGFTPSEDTAIMAKTLYQQAEGELLDIINTSSHARRLLKFNIQKDIEFCLTANKFQVVPGLLDGKIVALSNSGGISTVQNSDP